MLVLLPLFFAHIGLPLDSARNLVIVHPSHRPLPEGLSKNLRSLLGCWVCVIDFENRPVDTGGVQKLEVTARAVARHIWWWESLGWAKTTPHFPASTLPVFPWGSNHRRQAVVIQTAGLVLDMLCRALAQLWPVRIGGTPHRL